LKLSVDDFTRLAPALFDQIERKICCVAESAPVSAINAAAGAVDEMSRPFF